MVDQAEHDRLLAVNLERIEQAHTVAIERGREFPLVLALDLRDEVARKILNVTTGPFLVHSELPPDNPVTIYFVDLDDSIEKIGVAYKPAEVAIRHVADVLLRSEPGHRGCLYYFVAGGMARAKFHKLPA